AMPEPASEKLPDVIVTDALVAYAGTEIEPDVGAVLSRASVRVVSVWLLPAASVPCTGIVGAPVAVVHEMALVSYGPPAGVDTVSELCAEKPVPPERSPNVAEAGPEVASVTVSRSLKLPAALPL